MAHGLKEELRKNVTVFRDIYRESGVNTDEAEDGLEKLTKCLRDTWPASPDQEGGVQLDFGYFANVVKIGGQGIAISTDGIGSKAMIAWELQKFDTVGIDCVAMNVNDVICVGATPISMVDYIAIEEVRANIIDEISIGLHKGAKEAGVSISGGEIAQLKDMIHGFDLAGTAIGHVSLDKIVVGENIEKGDVLIGVESNGIHSNGLSLARKAFFKSNKYKLSHKFDELDTDLGTELLRPTHIYVREALELLANVQSVKALVHITSDGFLNLNRVKAKVSYVIDNLPPVPPIFRVVQKLEDIDEGQMFFVFNMGIGFCAVVAECDAELALSILSSKGKRAYRIGYATCDSSRTVRLEKEGLVGCGKHFRKA
jgi:phosphoribosylformylglycinamidine cyclo-ligase